MTTPAPHELIPRRLASKKVGGRIVYYPSVGSTMDAARVAAELGAHDGTAVTADEQTRGRGRLGRSWITPPDSSIALSVIVRPAMPDLPKVSLAGSLAVVRAIRRVTGVEASIKWPNDVLLGGRKVAGVLVESSVIGDALQSAVLGIGVNVNLETEAFPEISPTATSVHKHARGHVPRRELLAALLEELDDLYRSMTEGSFPIEEWRERLETIGREVRVRSAEAMEEGVAEAVNSQGALLLRRDDGSLIEVLAGEVTLRV